MKTVILAGGFGTRLSEYTTQIPKPMVPIGRHPLLWHLMSFYASYGFKEFILALGYRSEDIKQYFQNYRNSHSDFTVDLSNGNIVYHAQSAQLDWKITLVDTGADSMTGGRLKRVSQHLDDEPFMMTYGDGLSDVNLHDLQSFHQSHGKKITVTAVRPVARFGEMTIEGSKVSAFSEKPQISEGWINGGFFVLERSVLEYIQDDSTIFEKFPLE